MTHLTDKVKTPNRSRMQQVRSVHQTSQRQQADGQKLTSSSSSTNLQNLASSSQGGGSNSGPNTPSSGRCCNDV
jgi:hypothetical protein